MKLKRYLWITVSLIVLVLALPTYSQQRPQSHHGYQVSTATALMAGVYEGSMTLADLKHYGDFGLGTFEKLDGEMVFLNGKFHQIKNDGIASSVDDQVKTPFAVVTSFEKEQSIPLTGEINYQELQQQINKKLPTLNLPYAIRIQGTFPYLKVRSVPKQSIPYPPLDVALKEQSIFELQNIQGTLVGFRLPQYLKGANIAGYHFHFISKDQKKGGHLLDGKFMNPVADIETLDDWQIMLPKNASFKQIVLE